MTENNNTGEGTGKKDKKRQYSREYYQANKEQMLAHMKAYREANPETIKKVQRKWREENEGHTYTDSFGYVKYIGYSHPAATACGVTNHHRILLWDKLSGQDAPCNWCGKQVFWDSNDWNDRLVTDHVNTVRDDNRLENLVPACNRCNLTREGGQRPKPVATVVGDCGFTGCTQKAKAWSKEKTLLLCGSHWNQENEGRGLSTLNLHIRAVITETGRSCTKCGEHKPFDEFYLRGNGKHQSRCKACTAQITEAARLRRAAANIPCSVDDCGTAAAYKGMCQRHYQKDWAAKRKAGGAK